MGVCVRTRVYPLPAYCSGLVYYLWQLSIFKMDISYQKSGASCLAFCGNSWPPTKKKRKNKKKKKKNKYNAERQETAQTPKRRR